MHRYKEKADKEIEEILWIDMRIKRFGSFRVVFECVFWLEKIQNSNKAIIQKRAIDSYRVDKRIWK